MHYGYATELERAAHTLKSSSATFGAIEAAKICKELEDQGKQGQLEKSGTREKLSNLEALFKTVGRELLAYIERQTA